MITIYGLADPRTEHIRYVGQTNNLERRMNEHVWGKQRNNHKGNWIKSLVSNGLKPKLVILDEVLEELADLYEMIHIESIKEFEKAFNYTLTNQTEGGEGTRGLKRSEESNKKLSIARKGIVFSEQHKRRMSEAKRGNKYNIGRECSDEKREKISKTLTGRKLSVETRKKLSERHKGKKFTLGHKLTAEHKEKISQGINKFYKLKIKKGELK